MNTALRTRCTLLCLPIALAGFASCSSKSDAAAGTQSTSTVEPTTIVASTTTSTVAPTTTEAPTTTTEPPTTTTEAPTTTLAPNVEVVGAFGIEIKAVGSHNGPDTQTVQMRLEQLGFWSGGADGQYGFATVQAVMAFQKYLGLPPTGKVDQATAAYMQAFPERAHGRSDSGTLVEVDKARQLLFIVVDGKTVWTLNTSTGSGIPYEAVNKKDPTKIETGDAVTPNGLWKVTRRAPGRLVGGRPRQDLPPEVLRGWCRHPRHDQRAELPRVARLRAGEHPGDGLHLGFRSRADRHAGVGPRVTRAATAR